VGKKLAPPATSDAQGHRRMIAHSPASIALPHRAALPPLLALRAVPPPPPQARSAMLWGDANVTRIAARTAAEAVSHGVAVAVIDGAMRKHTGYLPSRFYDRSPSPAPSPVIKWRPCSANGSIPSWPHSR
jgi:hypothetical protein